MSDRTLTVDGKTITLSHPDKVLFPEHGLSKSDLADYYQRVAPMMLPHLRGRPLTLHRFPDGIGAHGFYQQNRSDHFPDWLPAASIDHPGGTGAVTHILCERAADLVYLASQATLTLHAWLSRVDRPHRPDQLVFDLDPPGDDFEPVRRAAWQVGDALRDAGLTPFVKTTGSRGLHVVAPLKPGADFDRVRRACRRLADHLVARHPDAHTAEQRKNKRHGRLYLDIMRNAFGQTAVAPYAVRAKPGAPVATPLDWNEVNDADIGPRRYRVDNLFRRLGQKDDPWADMAHHAADIGTLETALRAWERD